LTTKLLGAFREAEIIATCEEILRELGVDYLDLFLVHWPIRQVPFSETLGAFLKLQKAGKTRSIGVSNFTIRHLKDTFDCGVVPVTNQIEFHPYLNQQELLSFCQLHRIVVTAYSPLAQGKVVLDPILQTIGNNYHKSAVQVTLRWLLQKGVVAIPRSANKEQLLENGDVFDFTLSEEEMKKIDCLDKRERLVSGLYADFDYI
jgi:diketogulonate reductase-like aldo/keto reductase